MSLKTINDNCIVRLTQTKSIPSSIIITQEEPPCTGVVMAVGPGKTSKYGVLEEHNIQKGDIVVCGQSALNNPIEYNDETL